MRIKIKDLRRIIQEAYIGMNPATTPSGENAADLADRVMAEENLLGSGATPDELMNSDQFYNIVDLTATKMGFLDDDIPDVVDEAIDMIIDRMRPGLD